MAECSHVNEAKLYFWLMTVDGAFHSIDITLKLDLWSK